MIKRFIMIVVLLAGTALTVIFGEGFNFFDPDPTATGTIAATTTIGSTLPVDTTATTAFTETTVPTATSEQTSTPLPTETATATLVATSTPTNTATVTPTATSTTSPIVNLFEVQTGSPVFTVNFAHPEAGCNWQGVGGQVLAKDGSPLTNYILKITGKYNGDSVNQIGVSGLVTDNPYGPGSFEFVLGSTALDSSNSLVLQVFSPQGVEVIDPISLSTYASCSKNLQIINFQKK